MCKQQSPVKLARGLFLSPHTLQMDLAIFQQTLHHLAKNTAGYQKTHGQKERIWNIDNIIIYLFFYFQCIHRIEFLSTFFFVDQTTKNGDKSDKNTRKKDVIETLMGGEKDYDRLKEMDLSFRYTVSGLADRM